ncbi:hypothetical protein [Kitasatospora sp. NPDC047058]|uniref:hypothetical protein n=1 Tax=Kitasatospora sp. NPDC047058 TaxID=3155620 RepID=UPI0033EC6703
METAFSPQPGQLVQHPAGHDGELRGAVEELRAGRWQAARALLAGSWSVRSLWTSRTQALGVVAAHTDVLRHWAREEPSGFGLVTLQARASVELALMAAQTHAEPPEVAAREREARGWCWQAASTLAGDPVPWIGLLALAQLDPGQARPEHRVAAPDQMLPPGPWGLLNQAHLADPWCREAFHRMLRFWLARGDGGTAAEFVATYLPAAPSGSPLYALPLYLQVDRYRRAERKEAVALLWTNDQGVKAAAWRAYEHWRTARSAGDRWLVTDESHLAHALWATRKPEQAAEVFASLDPFVSSQPWASLSGRPEDLLRQAMAQSFAAVR